MPVDESRFVAWFDRRGIYYGWVVVAVMFVTLFVALGFRFAFGTFYSAILDETGWGRAETAGVVSAAMIVYAFSAAFAGWLFDRLGARVVFPIGTLSLRGSSMADEAPDGLARLRAVAELDRVFAFCHLPGKAGTVVALGAAGTNLVSLREKLDVWDPNRVHGATLDYEEISRSVGYLCEMTDDERRVLPGLEPGRERTIHLGALVLERGLYALRSAKCTVSVRGWRHSLLERGLLDLRS